jgi:uncharacterized protein (DUF362 family)
MKMRMDILKLVQSKATDDEKTFLRSLIEWMKGHADSKFSKENCIYKFSTGEYLLTTNTLRAYAKEFNSKSPPKSLDAIIQELRKLGIIPEIGTHMFDDALFHGIKIDMHEMDQALEGDFDKDNEGPGMAGF